MAYPAHLDGLIDILVEAVLRDLETTNENASVPTKETAGVFEHVAGNDHADPTPAHT